MTRLLTKKVNRTVKCKWLMGPVHKCCGESMHQSRCTRGAVLPLPKSYKPSITIWFHKGPTSNETGRGLWGPLNFRIILLAFEEHFTDSKLPNTQQVKFRVPVMDFLETSRFETTSDKTTVSVDCRDPCNLFTKKSSKAEIISKQNTNRHLSMARHLSPENLNMARHLSPGLRMDALILRGNQRFIIYLIQVPYVHQHSTQTIVFRVSAGCVILVNRFEYVMRLLG